MFRGGAGKLGCEPALRRQGGRVPQRSRDGRFTLLPEVAMYRNGIVLLTGLALVFLGVRFMTAQDKTAKGPDREADKAAIDKLIKENIQAFNNRDAAAIAANWTAEGEYIRND